MRALALLPLLAVACTTPPPPTDHTTPTADTLVVKDTLIAEGEKHFKSLKKLTFGGDNAEA